MTSDLQRYLDPSVLARIARLDLRMRLVVEGFLSGRHRSPFHGLSVEFAQHREYAPGDDLKHLDWKVFSRTDRYYVKQYEAETNLRAVFLVDGSESMRYASALRPGALSKFHYAACVAASLALLLLRQQDAVGLATFDAALRAWVPPSANPSQIKTIVHTLEAAPLEAKTDLEPVCHALAEKLEHRGLVCLISDLLVDVDGLGRGLRRLSHKGHDLAVLHVLDADELAFPFQGNTLFRGLEALGQLVVEPRALRQGYLDALEAFLADVRRRAVAGRADYRLLSTTDPLGAALAAFLAARAEAVKKAGSKRR